PRSTASIYKEGSADRQPRSGAPPSATVVPGRARRSGRTVGRLTGADELARRRAGLAALDHAGAPFRRCGIHHLARAAPERGEGGAAGLQGRRGGLRAVLHPAGEREEGRGVLRRAEAAVTACRGIELDELVGPPRRHERLTVFLLVLDDHEAVVECVER